ncbi:hypothetical protein HS125_21335, partial [bacterium]|nr:hypothetical protein [bacterium]
LFALLVAYGALQLARTQGWLGIGLAASVLIASALCGVFLVGRNFFHHRYFVFQVPFYALFAAAGARSLVDGACRRLSSPLSKGLALAGGVFLLCGLVGLRVAAAERLFGPPTGFAFAGQVVKAKYRPGDRVMILGPRSAFDRNMFFSEHTEPRYPLRREPFFARVGYLPTDAGMLEWALSGPGRTWLLRAYYGPWPDAVLYAKPRFHLFAEARQCDVYVARPTLGEPSVLTMFHVKHFPAFLPQATEITVVALDRLPLVVAADAESGAEKRVTWRLDGSLLTLERDADGTLASAPVWIEPGTHVLSLADGPESLRDLRVYADEGETIAAISRPRKVVFGGTVEFLGYDLEPSERLAPGDTLTVTYYWRALRRLEENLKLVLRYDSLDPRNPRAWVRIFNDHAGCYGLHPTCDWEPGRLVVERYNIRIPDTHPEGLCAIHAAVGVSGAIGTFDRRHAFDYHKYMAWSKDGEDVYTAGALEISSDRGPVFRVADSVVAQRAARGAPRQLSPALALLASHVEAATRDGASTLRLALLWECREPLDRHYRYHLTFRSPAGEDLPALVRPPFYDLYPTYAWQAGETLLDEMTLPLKEPLPGKATVVLQLATGQYDARGRLEAGETLGAPIPLGPLVWSATP